MEYDPARLPIVEDRLAMLQSLKRKYGATIEDILIYREKIADDLDQLLNRDERLGKEQEKLVQVAKGSWKWKRMSYPLSDKKRLVRLEEAIMQQLKDLHMEKSTFKVSINRKAYNSYDSNGFDEVFFLISTNLGEPLKPLVKIASGGELSRIMLALKTIFSRHQGITSIIFDEVDTGVSGRVAQAIADKIAMIATHSQVLCISHLPQVAAMADHHLLIRKEVKGKRTTTAVAEIY